MLVKKVIGMDSSPAMTGKCPPSDSGMMPTSQAAMASTMPLPLRMPVRTVAAKTMPTTLTTLEAWASSCSRCWATCGKLRTRAIATPMKKMTAGSMLPSTNSVMTARVRTRLGHSSFGRAWGRLMRPSDVIRSDSPPV